MNFINVLTNIIPILASLLSVVASVAAAIIMKKTTLKDKKISKMSIKWEDREIEIGDYSDKEIKEILEFITKFKDEEERQKDFACKKECCNCSEPPMQR